MKVADVAAAQLAAHECLAGRAQQVLPPTTRVVPALEARHSSVQERLSEVAAAAIKLPGQLRMRLSEVTRPSRPGFAAEYR